VVDLERSSSRTWAKTWISLAIGPLRRPKSGHPGRDGPKRSSDFYLNKFEIGLRPDFSPVDDIIFSTGIKSEFGHSGAG
jgi:hypothetical protein